MILAMEHSLTPSQEIPMKNRSLSIRALALVSVATALVAVAPTVAGAATIDVEIKGDFSESGNNGCALREAVRSANEQTSIGGCAPGENGLDTIRVPAGTYPLSIQGEDNGGELGDLDVSDALKIVGLGKGAVIDGGGPGVLDNRIFDLRLGDVTMRNLTIQNTRTLSVPPNSDGAGIRSAASVATKLDDVRLLNNAANGPSIRGGAISAEGPLAITDSVLAGNTAPFYGAIDAQGALVMKRTTVRDNAAAFGSGGIGITEPSKISESTFSGNRLNGETGDHNGAAMVAIDDLDLRNVTISENFADQGGGGMAAVNGSTVNLTNVTVTDNTADANQDAMNTGDGGGLYSENGGTFRLRNTVISGNADLTPPADGSVEPDCAAQLSLAGNNLIGDTEGCATQKFGGTPAELADGTAPLFGELGMNGGPTATVSIAKSSPLVNRIKAANCDDGGVSDDPGIGSDQRGVSRPQGSRCDVGAYERASCGGALVNRVGTGSADALKGTGGRDGVLGLGGKDTLRGKNGKDGVCGAGGKDKLIGGSGKDKLIGGPGADKLVGGPGKDVCIGGPGKDIAVGCEKVSGV